jgi:aerobic carbon-monoxide dehydrogenase large subunit
VTNSTPTGPVRGAGRPEATQMIERAMDLFAAEVSLDAAEVRRRNFIPADAFPTTTASGAHYDVGDYQGALDLALQTAGYDELRAEQLRRRERGDVLALGIGVSAYVEITNGINESEFGAVEITADGEAIVRTGSFSQGQGHETTFAQIVAERIGLPIEKITVLKGDTDVVARGTGTYGSKSTQIGGAAAGQASTSSWAASTWPERRSRVWTGSSSPPGSTATAGSPSSARRRTSRPRSRPSRSARTSRSSRLTPRRDRCICSG